MYLSFRQFTPLESPDACLPAGSQRIINLFSCWRDQLVEILVKLGMKSITELVGQTDCLRHLDYENE